VGLDICLSVARNLSGPFDFEVPKKLESLVAAGRLGKKNGKGFYTYEKGKPSKHAPRKSAPIDESIMDRIILRILNEAVACLRDGIVSDEDLVDAGAVFGFGFAPFLGGPMHYIHRQGAALIQAKLRILEQRYGSRFAPDPGWQTLIDKPAPLRKN
jgi:3-hydroxyacyl-CoA dehydrogenase/enoyl-CoA hydratase/3-hydroxybutyryl-CoA epimerase